MCFISEKVIVLIYVDNCIIMGKTEKEIDDLLKSLQKGNEKYDFTEEGDQRTTLEWSFQGILMVQWN